MKQSQERIEFIHKEAESLKRQNADLKLDNAILKEKVDSKVLTRRSFFEAGSGPEKIPWFDIQRKSLPDDLRKIPKILEARKYHHAQTQTEKDAKIGQFPTIFPLKTQGWL